MARGDARPVLSGDRFVVLGRAGMDFYADPPGARTETADRFVACLGGSAANIAVALVRQGARAELLTRVSDDAVGRFCLNRLDAHGVGRAHVRVAGGEARTSLAVVESRLEDHQSVIYRNGAADFALTVQDVEAVAWAAHSALVVTGTALAAEPSRGAAFRALDLARAAGLALVLDIDHRPYSWPSAEVAARTCAEAAGMCDIVIGNEAEFAILAGDPARGAEAAGRLAATTARIAVYKMGEKGAITFAEGRALRTGVYPARPLKPTGAGDAFMGAFLAALAAGRRLETAVLRGSAAAALVVGRVGCAPAMPEAGELDAFMAAQAAPPIA
ncbi:MAG: 5-dehydro-2-deoxygluconokinase [Rhodobacteraceae bacterium]|nr:5-dehydro-2-deoxygluconokinase [Paracoccaceae bacterium]